MGYTWDIPYTTIYIYITIMGLVMKHGFVYPPGLQWLGHPRTKFGRIMELAMGHGFHSCVASEPEGKWAKDGILWWLNGILWWFNRI